MWLRLREVELSIGVGTDVLGGASGGVVLGILFWWSAVHRGSVRVRLEIRGFCRGGRVGPNILGLVGRCIWLICCWVPGGKSKRLSQSLDMWPVALQRWHLIVGHLRQEWPVGDTHGRLVADCYELCGTIHLRSLKQCFDCLRSVCLFLSKAAFE